MAGDKMMQALGIGRAAPGAEPQAVLAAVLAQGQSGAAAKAQVTAAFGQIVAYGLPPLLAQGPRLEPGVAAGDQQERGINRKE